MVLKLFYNFITFLILLSSRNQCQASYLHHMEVLLLLLWRNLLERRRILRCPRAHRFAKPRMSPSNVCSKPRPCLLNWTALLLNARILLHLIILLLMMILLIILPMLFLRLFPRLWHVGGGGFQRWKTCPEPVGQGYSQSQGLKSPRPEGAWGT